MVRKFLLITLVSLVMAAGVAVAGLPDSQSVQLDNVSTNATISEVSSVNLNGELYEIWVELPTAVTTCSVQVVSATNAQNTVEVEFLNVSSLAASTVYRPRFDTHTTAGTVLGPVTNEMARGLLVNERLVLRVTSANDTNKSVRVKYKLR